MSHPLIGAYKLYSPIEGELVISKKDILVDKQKCGSWNQRASYTTTFEGDDKIKLRQANMKRCSN